MSHHNHDHGSSTGQGPSSMPGDMDMGNGTMGMMMMYFHGGFKETILFEQWQTTTVLGFVFSCVAICVIAFLYEGLKQLREYLFCKQSVTLYASQAQNDHNDIGTSPSDVRFTAGSTWTQAILSRWHVIQTLLHTVQVFVSYLLMLIFMTYNSYLCTSVIIGAAFGYFCFGWARRRIVDISDHCH